MPPELTIDALREEASVLAVAESTHHEPSLYGVTDGKKIGTYLEHKFRDILNKKYDFENGSSAKGIDFPSLAVDMKVTSIKQPQSSCPFKSASQKIYGLGYSLLIFVYDKQDNSTAETANLSIKHAVYVDSARTADFQMTSGLRSIIDNHGNQDDLVAFMTDKMLPIDDIQAAQLAQKLLEVPPEIGFLTISNALQWRLQYKRVIDKAGTVSGVMRLA